MSCYPRRTGARATGSKVRSNWGRTRVSSRGSPETRPWLAPVEHRPADVVAQPLIVEYELANRLREPVMLPPAFDSPCVLALCFRRSGTCGFDRIGGRTELVRGDVCD